MTVRRFIREETSNEMKKKKWLMLALGCIIITGGRGMVRRINQSGGYVSLTREDDRVLHASLRRDSRIIYRKGTSNSPNDNK